MSLFLQFLFETPSVLVQIIAAIILVVCTFWMIVRDGRKLRKLKKEMLRSENERRAIFGLPPAKKWDE